MNLKEVKQRIQSVKNTQKITSAMKLVSAAKLRRAQSAAEGVRPYKEKLNEILVAFLGALHTVKTPLTAQREAKKIAVVAVSSSSSLCGSFNANVIRAAKERVDEYIKGGVEVEIYPVGKKMFEAFKKQGLEQNLALMEQAASVAYNPVSEVASVLMERFISGDIDKVELIFTHFHSAAKQTVEREIFLPIDINVLKGDGELQLSTDYIIEPSAEELVQSLLPKVVTLNLYTALLDSTAAEHAARMMAMQIATDNADDLITELVREYNKGRQQAITNELLDMVSGSVNQ